MKTLCSRFGKSHTCAPGSILLFSQQSLLILVVVRIYIKNYISFTEIKGKGGNKEGSKQGKEGKEEGRNEERRGKKEIT